MATAEEVKQDPNYRLVLDHGFVGLIDTMGDDSAIEQAARVSYGKGTRKTSETRGLIRYLLRHKHTSPFEQVEFKFHCKIPIFVARQWVRHRTACLTGDNYLYFELPSSKSLVKVKIHEVHKKWNKHPALKEFNLEMLDEKKEIFLHTRITDIWESGVKDVYTLKLVTGETITCSKDHLLHTDKGWKQLKELYNIDNSSFIDENVRISVNDNNKLKFSKIKSINYVGKKLTFDLEVKGPFHNFVCNGIVTHNSLNEYSGRYSEMTDEMYIPKGENLSPQSVSNKQGREGSLDPWSIEAVKSAINKHNEKSYLLYQSLLGNKEKGDSLVTDQDGNPAEGIARELARVVLPLNTYTEWFWKIDLWNLFHFLKLRLDPHAQYEIKVYAEKIYELIKPKVPLACEAFEDYILKASNFSQQESNMLTYIVKCFEQQFGFDKEDFEKLGVEYHLSKREMDEFLKKILD